MVVNKKRNISFSLFSVTGILIIAKILGFIKQIVVAGFFGATIETDLINLSEGFISNVDYIIVNTLTTAILTQFVHVKAKSEEEANALVTNTMLFFFLSITALTGILIFLSPYISRLLAPSFSQENLATLSRYLMILLPCIIFISLSSIGNGILQSQKKFIPGQIASLIQSVLTISIVVVFGEQYGAVVLIPAFIIYSVLNFVFLFLLSKREWKLSLKYKNPFKNSFFVEELKIMAPLFLAYGAIFINQQVDKIIVSGMTEGAISSMTYAATLSNFVIAIITALTGVVYSHITNELAAGDEKSAMHIASKFIELFVSIFIPVTIISMVDSFEIVSIAYLRGKFDLTAAQLTSLALTGYALSFVFYSIKSMTNKILYSYKNTKWPMISSLVAIAINILLSIILSQYLGILGVALASSISEIIACVFNSIILFVLKIPLRFDKPIFKIIKWGLITSFSLAISFLFKSIDLHFAVRFALTFISISFLCCAVYSFDIYNAIKKRINKNRLEEKI